ncbi:MAG: 6-bladed beta-propeller [Rikenellaceae bacterium]
MKKLTTLILFLALVSCQETAIQVATLENGVICVEASNVKDTLTMKLSNLVEDIEIVQLESSLEAYVSENSPIAISENYIGAGGNNQLKLFNRKTGEFLTNIGTVGNGPGEYMKGTNTLYINEKRNAIFVVNFMGTKGIYEYDLQGNYKRTIPLANKNNMAYYNISIDDNKDLISAFGFSRNVIVWQQDFEGNYIKEDVSIAFESKKPKVPYTRISNDFFNICVNQYHDLQDTLYSYDKEKHAINPVFTMKLNNFSECDKFIDTKTISDYIETPKYFITTIRNIEKGNRGMTQIFDKHIFINKNNLSGNIVKLNNDYLYNSEIDKIKVTGEYLYNILAAEKLLEILENATDEQRKGTSSKALKKLDQISDNLDEESNVTLIFGKF